MAGPTDGSKGHVLVYYQKNDRTSCMLYNGYPYKVHVFYVLGEPRTMRTYKAMIVYGLIMHTATI